MNMMKNKDRFTTILGSRPMSKVAKSGLFVLMVLALTVTSSTGWAKKRDIYKSTNLSNPKYGSIVIDAQTGMILSESGADRRLHPASLTKMMTLLMTFEALDRGQLRLYQRLRVSKHASQAVPSKLGLKYGERITVKNAILALVTKSANDVAIVLGEAIAGSEKRFARQMTAKAHKFGMTKTVFKNANGLHNPRQVSSPRDMARLAQVLLRKYPKYYHYFSTRNFHYKGQSYKNHNKLLGTYKGMDGLKTGYVKASGFNLVASAVQDRKRVIAVVFGGRTGKIRNAHMKVLLDRGFARLRSHRPKFLLSSYVPEPPKKPSWLSRPTFIKVAKQEPKTVISNNPDSQNYAMATAQIPQQDRDFLAEIIGEGDSDPSASRRIETGLMTLAVHTGKTKSVDGIGSYNPRGIKMTPRLAAVKMLPKVRPLAGNWSVRLGTYSSRAATETALRDAQRRLPPYYVRVNPGINVSTHNNSLLFHASLNGFSREGAQEACGKIKGSCKIVKLLTPQ